MIRDITLGQYYSVDSVIHRLDPRVKLAFTVLYIAALYVAQGAICFVFAAMFLATMIILSKVPVSFMVKGLRSVMILLIFSALFNLFLVGGQVLVHWWIFTITVEGIK